MGTKRQLLELMDTESLLNILRVEAMRYGYGHYTIMAFPTGYKIKFGTPEIDLDKVSELISFQTLKEALVWGVLWSLSQDGKLPD